MQPRDACGAYNIPADGTRVAGGVLRDYEEAREDTKNEWQEEVDDVLSSDRTRTVSRNLAVAVLCIGAAVTLLRVVVMFSIHALRSRRATSPNDVEPVRSTANPPHASVGRAATCRSAEVPVRPGGSARWVVAARDPSGTVGA